MMYKLIIADDHKLVVDGYKAMLSDQKDIKIIKEVKDGWQLLNYLQKVTPDLIILDLEMPNMNGYMVLKELQTRKEKPKTLVISLNDEATTIHELFHYGANGYLSKQCLKREFIDAIYAVIRTHYFLDPKLKQRLANLERHSKPSIRKDSLLNSIEKNILERIFTAQKNSVIAHELCMSEHTVDFHRRNIYKKTGTKNVVELIKYAVKHELVNLR